jgi:predicted regulator of Ras-like GTPase activity (Roadblock/LC7/MglB family)
MEVVSEIIQRVSEDNYSHPTNLSKVIVVKLANVLSELVSDCSDIVGAMVSSSDGHALAERIPQEMDKNRFAAMSCALLALSDNLIKEAHQGTPRNILIESGQGNIFVMHAGSDLLLTVFTKMNSNLGMSLAHAKKVADEIESLNIGKG